MNDDARYERLYADVLGNVVPSRAPAELRFAIKSSTSRMRPRPHWLAVLKEPPMRISSTVVVGSPTARTAAILAATLLIGAVIAGAGIAGTRHLAADGTIVVDQSGGGDYRTIAEAVAAADDGDIVLVRPGTYVEAVTIDEDITLRGDGPLGDIVITAPEGGPTSPIGSEGAVEPYAVLISDSVATLRGAHVPRHPLGGHRQRRGTDAASTPIRGHGHALPEHVARSGGSSTWSSADRRRPSATTTSWEADQFASSIIRRR